MNFKVWGAQLGGHLYIYEKGTLINGKLWGLTILPEFTENRIIARKCNYTCELHVHGNRLVFSQTTHTLVAFLKIIVSFHVQVCVPFSTIELWKLSLQCPVTADPQQYCLLLGVDNVLRAAQHTIYTNSPYLRTYSLSRGETQ